MNPKEKAKELILKYTNLTDKCDCLEYMCVCFSMYDYKAKQCALIAVDEVLSVPYLLKSESWFYKEVKQEIEKL